MFEIRLYSRFLNIYTTKGRYVCVISGLFKESLRHLNPGPFEYEAVVPPAILKAQNWPFDPLKRK